MKPLYLHSTKLLFINQESPAVLAIYVLAFLLLSKQNNIQFRYLSIVLIISIIKILKFLSFCFHFSGAIFTPEIYKNIMMDNIRLKKTISSRLTNPEHEKLNQLVKRQYTTKSELIRDIVRKHLRDVPKIK